MLAAARTHLSEAKFSFEAYRNYVTEVETLAKYMVSIDETLTTVEEATALINGWLA